jgi:hypothetical protein
MLFNFRGSSGQTPPAWSVIEQASSQPQAASPAIDPLAEWTFDEPLPLPPPVDEIHLLVQSPTKLFLYWDAAHNPFEILRRSILNADDYRLVVRLTDLTTGEISLYEAAPTREQFFSALPGRNYRAEIGFFAPNRPFVRLLTSSRIETPRSGVARESDAGDFHLSAEEFTRVLDESGYVSDALEVALEAADKQMQTSFTRIVAETITGGDASLFNDEDVFELRRFLSAIAFGAHAEDLRGMFSPKVASWFEESFAHFAPAAETARLIEIMRAAFNLEIDYAGTTDETDVFRHEPARVVLGASGVHMPGGRPPHLRWMPSMTAGLATRLLALERLSVA